MAYTALTQYQTAGSGRLGGSIAMRYPSPYLDIGNTYYPQTVREMLQLCRLFYWTHPIISATVNKLARYPLTDLVFVHSKSDRVADFWRELMCDTLRIRTFLLRVHLDTLVSGNAFVSIIYPFKRRLVCRKCKSAIDARMNYDQWEYTGNGFVLACPTCGHRGAAKVDDLYVRSPKDVKLHLWDPMDVVIEDSEYPGTTRYLYRIPKNLANAIRLGKKAVVAQVPLHFLEAVEKSRQVVFAASNFMHVKRQVVTGKHKGWGMPLIMNVLKLAFYLQIMMKTQETVLLEHLLPLRILFPQAPSATADPFNVVWMTNWKAKVEEEIRHWRQDPAYMPVVPLPIGAQSIGGEGRALLITPELRAMQELLVACMEVPTSFVFSGGNYSGSIVDMRQLENLCLGMVEDDRDVVRWIIENMSAYLKTNKPESWHFKPFKQADDLMRRQLYFALYDRNLASGHTVAALNDLDFKTETEMRTKELSAEFELLRQRAKSNAEAQADAQIIQAKAVVRAQAAQAQQAKGLQQGPMSGTVPPGGIGGPQSTEQPEPSTDDLLPTSPLQASEGMSADPNTVARHFARELSGMDQPSRDAYLMQLKTETPQFHGLVMQNMSAVPVQQLPDQRPPRAEAGMI